MIFKRSLDIVFAFTALLLLTPLLLIIAFLVYLNLGSPVIFKHQRSGIDQKPFTLYKFRTMHNSVDKSGKQLPDKDRVSTFGVFLRTISIDELPTLYNVLIGDMSLVGPRPLLVRYGPHYEEWQKERFRMKPGITGLAQVNGRNAISWIQKFKYDVEYIENYTILLDIKIILKTMLVVIRSKNTTDGIRKIGQVPFDEIEK